MLPPLLLPCPCPVPGIQVQHQAGKTTVGPLKRVGMCARSDRLCLPHAEEEGLQASCACTKMMVAFAVYAFLGWDGRPTECIDSSVFITRLMTGPLAVVMLSRSITVQAHVARRRRSR